VKTRYQENTNLTQISDWLTKILIGASLVELKEIPKFVYHVARVMGTGINNSHYLKEAASTTCAAIILYFVTCTCQHLLFHQTGTDQQKAR